MIKLLMSVGLHLTNRERCLCKLDPVAVKMCWLRNKFPLCVAILSDVSSVLH
jgi:hypothetical protein